MESIFLKIVIGVGIGIIIALILGVRRIFICPKIELKYTILVKRGFASESRQPKCEWQGEISLYNSSPHDAFKVAFLFPKNWNLTKPPLNSSHVTAKGTQTIPFNVPFDKPYGRFCEDFCPPELNTFRLGLQYSNEWGIFTFYTLLMKAGDTQNSTRHCFNKPKI